MSNDANATIYYLSIDPSISCTGVSVLSVSKDKYILHYKTSLIPDTPRKHDKTKFIKKNALGEIFDFCINYIQNDLDLKISFAVFEDYSYGSVGHLAHLGELNGIYKYILAKHKIEFDVIAPSSIKKIITGSGRAFKADVAEKLKDFVLNYHEFSFNNYDETDSVAVGVAYGEYIKNNMEKDNNEPSKNTKKNR